MSEVDAKYPRDDWLQMLLDKGVRIDNFEEYWTYLSKRDELVELEKRPEVWAAGLFGIAPAKVDCINVLRRGPWTSPFYINA